MCRQLVARLREAGGETLGKAADTYDAYQGRVVLQPNLPGDIGSSSENFVQLGTGASMTDLGLVQPGESDLLILAVHEAGHLQGIGGEYGTAGQANFQQLLTLERKAFTELKSLNYSAPLSYLRLNHYGSSVNFYRPLPPGGGE